MPLGGPGCRGPIMGSMPPCGGPTGEGPGINRPGIGWPGMGWPGPTIGPEKKQQKTLEERPIDVLQNIRFWKEISRVSAGFEMVNLRL